MSKNVVNILIISLVTLLAWIGSELYFLGRRDINVELDKNLTGEIIEPINPTLNTKALERLKTLDNDIAPVEVTPEGTKSATGSATASASTSVTPTPTLSKSGPALLSGTPTPSPR